MINSLDQDQARHFDGPDLGPNCLCRLSADNTRRQRIKEGVVFGKMNWKCRDSNCIAFAEKFSSNMHAQLGALFCLSLRLRCNFSCARAIAARICEIYQFIFFPISVVWNSEQRKLWATDIQKENTSTTFKQDHYVSYWYICWCQ